MAWLINTWLTMKVIARLSWDSGLLCQQPVLPFGYKAAGIIPPPLFFPTAVSVLANFHVPCLSAVGFNCAVSIFNNSCGPRKNPGLLRQFLAEGDQTLWMIQSSTCMLPADTGLKGEKTILNHNLSKEKKLLFSI